MAAAAATPQVHEEFHKNGRLACRYETINGKKHGVMERWENNGHLTLRQTWACGMPQMYEYYHTNGSISARIDVINETYEKWYANGQQQQFQVDKNGRALIVRNWDADGKPDLLHWRETDPNSCS